MEGGIAETGVIEKQMGIFEATPERWVEVVHRSRAGKVMEGYAGSVSKLAAVSQSWADLRRSFPASLPAVGVCSQAAAAVPHDLRLAEPFVMEEGVSVIQPARWRSLELEVPLEAPEAVLWTWATAAYSVVFLT